MKKGSSVLVSSIACGLVLLAAVHHKGRAEQKTDKLKTATSVANALDKILQPRFHKDSGKFGISRMGLPGHTNVLGLREETPEEKPLLKAIQQAGYAYALGFFRCAHKPGTHFTQVKEDVDPSPKPEARDLNHYWTVGVVQSRKYFSNGEDGVPEREAKEWAQSYQPAIEKACLKALPLLKQGKSVDTHYKKWLIALRPVRATDQKCLGCHETAKKGDTLGVIVYTVQNSRQR